MEVKKSKFWRYKEFQSRHFRKSNKNSKSGWVGPQFFETEINEIEYRKYLRDVLGIKNSEHLEVDFSFSEAKNDDAKRVAINYLNDEINGRQSKIEGIYGRALKSKRIQNRIIFVEAMLNYA